MVRNKLRWDANDAVGLPKQRNSYQSSPTFLCFGSPTASFASQRNLFRAMWPDPAKGLLICNDFCRLTSVSLNQQIVCNVSAKFTTSPKNVWSPTKNIRAPFFAGLKVRRRRLFLVLIYVILFLLFSIF